MYCEHSSMLEIGEIRQPVGSIYWRIRQRDASSGDGVVTFCQTRISDKCSCSVRPYPACWLKSKFKQLGCILCWLSWASFLFQPLLVDFLSNLRTVFLLERVIRWERLPAVGFSPLFNTEQWGRRWIWEAYRSPVVDSVLSVPSNAYQIRCIFK